MTEPSNRTIRPQHPPSDWSPRPIPQPVEPRRTADPPTPTLKELAERERQRASLAAAPALAWLELTYTHADDGSPMAGAPYRVRFSDGSTREGRLDGQGRARLDGLPAALAGTAVDVRFGEPSAEFRPLPVRAEPNPDYQPAALAALTTPGGPMYAESEAGAPRYMFASYTPGLQPGDRAGAHRGLAGAVVAAPDGPVPEALEYLWSLAAGAYRQDPTTGEIVGQMIVAMIPVVGQVADVRDLSAYVYQLSRPDVVAEARRAAWVGLVLTGVALMIPVAGAAVSGVGRLALKGGPEAERLALPLLRRVGRGNALKFLERELSAARIEEHAEAALARVSGYLRGFFAAVERTWLPVGDAVREAARRALADLGRVAAEGRAAIRQVAGEIAAKVKPLLAKIEKEGEHAAGTTNARVEQKAEAEAVGRPPEPEGPSGDKESRLAALKRQRIERIREERLREGIARAERAGKLGDLSRADQEWLAADPRRKALAYDPDTGSFKPQEARAALAAEGEGVLHSPVRRSGFNDLGEGGADYIDGAHRLWDVRDASANPVALVRAARDGENILVDATRLSSSARAALEAAIEKAAGGRVPSSISIVPRR